MPELAEFLRARRELVHGLAGSLAIVGANVEALQPFVEHAEGLNLLIDIECSVDAVRVPFDRLHDDRDLGLEERQKTINDLANAVSIIALALAALDRYVTAHREGRSIYADMLIACARARTQFEALRKLI